MESFIGDEIINSIETRLHELNDHEPIQIFGKSYNFKGIDYDFIQETNHFCLPNSVRPAITENRVDRFYFEIFFNAIKKEHPDLVRNGIEATIEKELANCYPPQTLLIAITDMINNLRFNWRKVIEVTKNRDYFGIDDEEKIVINHLNRYNEVLNSKEYQIEIVQGLIYSKEISDLFLQLLIRLLENRLNVLNPELVNNKQQFAKEQNLGAGQFQFFWNGTQNELLELFVTLQEKGWINQIPKGRITLAAKSITRLFDIAATRKSTTSDPVNSFSQILKGEINNDQKRDYTTCFGMNYEYKFSSIKESSKNNCIG